MTTHANILAWEIPWTEEPDGLPWWGADAGGGGHKELDTTEGLNNRPQSPKFKCL